MARRKSNTDNTSKNSTANIGYEAKLWLTADKLRNTLLPKLLSGELRIGDAEKQFLV